MPTYSHFYDEFDELQFFDATKGSLVIVEPAGGEPVGVIPVASLGISEHPFQPGEDMVYLDRAFLVFEGLVLSRRRLKRYDEDGKLSADIEESLDFASLERAPETEDFALEGVCQVGGATFYALEWQVEARRFSLLIPDDAEQAPEPWTTRGTSPSLDPEATRQFLAGVPDEVWAALPRSH